MSGDSPNSHRNELYDFGKDGRGSPVPTSSREIALPPLPPIPSSTTAAQDAVLAEPSKDKESDEKTELCSPCANNQQDDSRISDPDKTIPLDDVSYSGKKDKDKEEKKPLNGQLDKVDGVYMPNQDIGKKPAEEEDDDCTVKCLYYTLQCCECVIV